MYQMTLSTRLLLVSMGDAAGELWSVCREIPEWMCLCKKPLFPAHTQLIQDRRDQWAPASWMFSADKPRPWIHPLTYGSQESSLHPTAHVTMTTDINTTHSAYNYTEAWNYSTFIFKNTSAGESHSNYYPIWMKKEIIFCIRKIKLILRKF